MVSNVVQELGSLKRTRPEIFIVKKEPEITMSQNTAVERSQLLTTEMNQN